MEIGPGQGIITEELLKVASEVIAVELDRQLFEKLHSNTMAAILYYPWWNIHIVHHFHRSDFSPHPRVDSVLLHIQSRQTALIPSSQKNLYQDFVAYHFTRDRFAKHIPASQWLKLFNHFTTASNPEKLKSIQGTFAALQQEQQNLQKNHRTRTDHKVQRN